MSAVLTKTWNFLSHNLSTLVGSSGPRWSVPDPEAGPAAHLPAGLAQFLHALYLCQCRDDERQLVERHMAAVEEKLRESNLKAAVVADAIVRCAACHVLGYDVAFAHIHALQLAQKGNVLEKKMGYLACTLFLTPSDQLSLLLVNTLLRDLASKNVVEVNIALSAAVHLTPVEMAPMLLPILVDKLTHSKDFIRKKSLICLQRLVLQNPHFGPQLESRVHQCLSDPDPGVVAIAVQVSRTLAEVSRKECDFKLVPSLVAILDQILSNRLPSDYNRQGMPAPFFQVDILQLLAVIVAKAPWDAEAYQTVTSAVVRAMEAANPKDTSGQAVLVEAIQVIAALNRSEADPTRTSKALFVINRFLQSKHNNVKYVGLAALESVLRSSPPKLNAAQEENVLNCLTHYDDSIKRKTLSLLYVLANRDNVRKICEKLVEHIRAASADDYQREDLIAKAADLAETFSLGLDWYAQVLLKLLQNSTGKQREVLMQRLKSSVTTTATTSGEVEVSKEEQDRVGWKMTAILKKVCSAEKPPVTALRMYVWCLSQFHHMEEEEGYGPLQAAEDVCQVGQRSHKVEEVLSSCLDALFSLLPALVEGSEVVQDFARECHKDGSSAAVSDLAYEVLMLLPNMRLVEEKTQGVAAQTTDFTMTYLDAVVVEAMRTRASLPYVERPAVTREPEAGGLRFTPYQLLDEGDRWKEESMVASTRSLNVWSLEGRTKLGDPAATDDAVDDVKVIQEADHEEQGNTSALELESQDWRD